MDCPLCKFGTPRRMKLTKAVVMAERHVVRRRDKTMLVRKTPSREVVMSMSSTLFERIQKAVSNAR